ncbi:hypothetical protein JYT83_01335 [bacterium AH-315-F18]|nr:hypothetical protein [bacterium AH-315-F18]
MPMTLEPGLLVLLAKTAWCHGLTAFIGGSFFPRAGEDDHPWVRWPLQMLLGAAVLLVVVVNLIWWGAAGGWVVAVLPLALLVRGFHRLRAHRHPKPRSADGGGLLKFILITFMICLLALFPFLVRGTSGFCAISGGDHQGIITLGEYFLDHSTADPVEADGPRGYMPPAAGWETQFWIFAMQTQERMTFSHKPVITPFFALTPGSRPETYTAVLAFFLALIVWNAAALMSYAFRRRRGLLLAGVGFLLLGNLLPWSVARHSAHALIGFAVFIAILRLWWSRLEGGRVSPMMLGVLATALAFAYPPALLLAGLSALLGAPVLLWRTGTTAAELKRLTMEVVGVLVIIACLANNAIGEVMQVLFFGAGFSFRPLGYPWWGIPLAITGSVDNDILLTNKLPTALSNLIIQFLAPALSLATAALAVYGLRRLGRRRSWLPLACLLPPLAVALTYAARGGGQYQSQRLVEMGSLFMLPLAGIGWMLWFRSSGNLGRWLAPLLLVCMVSATLPIKYSFYGRILGWTPSEVSDFKGSDALRLAQALPDISRTIKARNPRAMVYWFDWGPVRFAGSSVLCRSIPYFEAFNYPYYKAWTELARRPIFADQPPHVSFSELDTLAHDRLNGAALIVPDGLLRGIFTQRSRWTSPPRWRFPGYSVYDTSIGQGATILGPGWNSPVADTVNPFSDRVQYLMGRERGNAAIVAWSPERRQVHLRLWAYGTEDGQHLVVQAAGEPLRSLPLPRWNGDTEHFVNIPWQVGPGVSILRLASVAAGISPSDLEATPDLKPTPWTLVLHADMGDEDGKPPHVLSMEVAPPPPVATWIGQGDRDLVGPGVRGGPNDHPDVLLQLNGLTPGRRILRIRISAFREDESKPTGSWWGPEGNWNLAILGEGARRELFFEPHTDLHGMSLKITVEFEKGSPVVCYTRVSTHTRAAPPKRP